MHLNEHTWHTADCTRKIPWLAGVRRSTTRLSSRVSWPTVGAASPAARAFSMASLLLAAQGSDCDCWVEYYI